jgi:hypothetical protein
LCITAHRFTSLTDPEAVMSGTPAHLGRALWYH